MLAGVGASGTRDSVSQGNVSGLLCGTPPAAHGTVPNEPSESDEGMPAHFALAQKTSPEAPKFLFEYSLGTAQIWSNISSLFDWFHRLSCRISNPLITHKARETNACETTMSVSRPAVGFTRFSGPRRSPLVAHVSHGFTWFQFIAQRPGAERSPPLARALVCAVPAGHTLRWRVACCVLVHHSAS